VIGLMDPAHGPFVHRSWWWRNEASIHEKAKAFHPSTYGFTMTSHAPSSNSAAYKLLGGDVTTEIAFRLPGIRVETIRAGKHFIVGLTTVTPVNETETEVRQTFFWSVPWLSLLKPFLRPFAKAFLDQDRSMVDLQAKGLKFNPRLMLIDDSDMQAKWYYQLKREWQNARAEARAFQNPIREATVLRWRS
jgi:phenylpropionate dioxygenase-like ring-hydroxylating dioxygenase large terminal subunit